MERELLFSVTRKDFDIVAFRGSGNGGQNRNTRDTACRIRHRDSGAVAEAQEHRTFDRNRRAAFGRLVETVKFRVWLNAMTNLALGRPSIETVVDEMMRPENLKVEVKDANGRWAVEDPGQ